MKTIKAKIPKNSSKKDYFKIKLDDLTRLYNNVTRLQEKYGEIVDEDSQDLESYEEDTDVLFNEIEICFNTEFSRLR